MFASRTDCLNEGHKLGAWAAIFFSMPERSAYL